MQQDIRTT